MIAGGGPELPLWFAGVFVCLFPIGWCGVSFVLSQASGWREIAQQHPAGEEPRPGAIQYLCSGQTGAFGVNYRSCLNVSLGREGLYVVPLRLFRLFHPPLLLPWSCVTSVGESRTLLLHLLEVRCEAGGRSLKLFLPLSTALRIAELRANA